MVQEVGRQDQVAGAQTLEENNNMAHVMTHFESCGGRADGGDRPPSQRRATKKRETAWGWVHGRSIS